MHYTKTKSILSPGNTMNLYRGCTHGCIYCDSRGKCYRMTHCFEDIEVKENGLLLLKDALRRKKAPCMLSTGSMTDPYIPLEEELGYIRQALTLADRYGFGFTLITKSSRVLRDLSLLKSINDRTKCVIQMTLTTYDETLCKKLEPNVSSTAERVNTLKTLHAAGIPTVVWLSPILPFLNDTEENILGILNSCKEAGVMGVVCFGMGLTLRDGSREYFYKQLDRLFPGLKERYMETYGDSYFLPSPNNDTLMQLFHTTCEKYGMLHDNDAIFSYLRTFEEKNQPEQIRLF